ncbi:hypothetical protein ELE61_30245, partial [Klebsiella pneumoniae]|nr:hypothetical protein [Klebsiella pneumoniae]
EAFDKFGKATDKTIGQVILAQRTGENGPTGESDGNVTTITTTDAGDASDNASGASGGAVDGSAGSVAGAAGGSEEGAESNNTEPTPTPAPKREPKPNIKTQPSVFDVLPKKISKEIVDNSLDVINRIVTEAKEIPFMEDGAEVLAKAQYQLTL